MRITASIAVLALAHSATAVSAGAAATPELEFGPHGGVVGLPPGGYACVAYDEVAAECLVRAIREEEIEAARSGRSLERTPQWMRISYAGPRADNVEAPPPDAVGLYELPGLLDVHLDPEQTVLVRCLAGTDLGLPLERWQDPWVYQRGLVEDCKAEARRSARGGGLPLAAATLQEAAVIHAGSQRLVDANLLYAAFAGQSAGSIPELLEGPVLRAPPPRTPSMTPRGYAIARSSRVTVDLKPDAAAVCRALNLLLGRDWQSLTEALPDGARSGCYATATGYRYEAGG